MAYTDTKPEVLQVLNIKAHQVRGMAASWALLGGVSVDDIAKSCHWASHNTFTSFYLQPLTWSDGETFLGPIIAAKHQVNFT